MKRALIFDFNGTMIFDTKIQKMAWQRILKRVIGREITADEFNQYVAGRNNQFTFSHFLNQELSSDQLADLSEQKEQGYRQLCLQDPENFRLVSGLAQFLTQCQKAELPMTIATASATENVDFFFEELKLDQWFDRKLVALNDGTVPGKPAPDIFIKAMQQLSVTSQQSIIFEDSSSGIEAARAAKARFVIQLVDPKYPADFLQADSQIQDYQKTWSWLKYHFSD